MKKLTGIFIGLAFLVCAVTAQAIEISDVPSTPVATTPCTLEEALDAPELVWSTWGDEDWFCQSDESYDGVSAAQSGPIADNETGWTYLEAEVTVEELQQLSFHWKLFSSSGDYFYFFVNDEEQTYYSGSDFDWRQKTVQLLPGTNTLRWEFHKGQAIDNSSAWIDNIMIDDVHALDLLAYYADNYKTPSIPQPLFVKNRVAKAGADECYDNGTVGEPVEGDNCTSGDPKTNQAYVWGMARSGNLWFGTVANTQCLIVGGLVQGLGAGLPATEAPNFVCEFNEADNGTVLGALGDWRPPQIFEYDPDTLMVVDQTPQDLYENPTLGIRSAGAIDGIVLLAGPSLDGTEVNVFAFSDDGAYLGMDILTEYNDIRQWVVHDGIMYTGVQKTTASGMDYKGRILRYDGLSFAPFQINFEVVGKIDLEAANMTIHRNRLFVTTWPSMSLANLSPYVSGLWMSPEIPAGTGLTGSDNESWQQVWSATDYEPDAIVARTYGGGALASYDGTLFWGTMHVPMTGTLAAVLAEQSGLINLKGLDNETMGVDDIVATALGTHRAISIFSSTFESSETTIDLLYGDEFLPVYDPAARSYTIAEDDMHRNNMGIASKWGPAGIGNFFNAYTWTMDVGFEDTRGGLLLGTFDWSFVARDLVGIILEEFMDDNTDIGMALELIMNVFDGIMEGYSYGADLFVIQDADAPFILESSDGAGNYLNYGIRTMLMPSSASEATMTAPAVMEDTEQCPQGYFGMANPFNLAEDGGWELISIYPLPELALVAPMPQEFIMGDYLLQAQDLSTCPLSSVEFIVSNIFAQTFIISAAYYPEKGLWKAILPTTQFPNGIYFVLTSGSDADGVQAAGLPQTFIIDNDCGQDSDCDDGLYCTGIETCDIGNGTCAYGTDPCDGEQVCDEGNATCAECLETGDCEFGYVCEQTSNVCAVECPLTVTTKKGKPIILKPGKNGKVRKDKKIKLFLSGGEGFDLEGIFDAGPFTYNKRKICKKRKGQLKIKLTIPGTLAPGTYPISLGGCLGEVTFTEKQ